MHEISNDHQAISGARMSHWRRGKAEAEGKQVIKEEAQGLLKELQEPKREEEAQGLLKELQEPKREEEAQGLLKELQEPKREEEAQGLLKELQEPKREEEAQGLLKELQEPKREEEAQGLLKKLQEPKREEEAQGLLKELQEPKREEEREDEAVELQERMHGTGEQGLEHVQCELRSKLPEHTVLAAVANVKRGIPSPIIEATFANAKVEKQFPLLFDSGASISVVTVDLLKALRATYAPTPNGSQNMLNVANATSMQMLGTCKLEVIVAGRRMPWTFMVVETLVYAAVVGVDFLYHHKIKVDTVKLHVDVNGTTVPYSGRTTETESKVVTMPLRIVASVSIPPFSEMLVPVSLPRRHRLQIGVKNESAIEIAGRMAVQGNQAVVTGAGIADSEWLAYPRVSLANFSRHATSVDAGVVIADIIVHPDPDTVAVLATEDDEFFPMDAAAVRPDSDRNVAMQAMKDIVQGADGLDNDQRSALGQLLFAHGDLFTDDTGPRSASVLPHEIKTGDAKPTKSRPYRVGPAEEKVQREKIEELVQKGYARPSTSPWSAPVVLVRKKDGSWRFCIDYRKLNKVTERDVYPLPRIDDTLQRMRGAKVFSALDLAHGFWQIPLAEEDRAKSAFITPFGLYEFNVMPMGLSNAPASFQRAMNAVLAGVLYSACLVYMDDILVFSPDGDRHLKDLDSVFHALKAAGLKLRLEKCALGRKEVAYLGHVVSEAGISTSPKKVSKLLEMRSPANITDLRAFLGLANYYRSFVPRYADLSSSLTKKLRKGLGWEWNEEDERAAVAIKTEIAAAATLAFPDFSLPFLLQCDASKTGISAILAQVRDNEERPIWFASRVLCPAEQNYSVTEREALAVVWGVHEFRHFLTAHPFVIQTDHSALQSLLTHKEPQGRLARWVLSLQPYQFVIRHRPGSANANADALSRLLTGQILALAPLIATPEFVAADAEVFRSAQRSDPALGPILEYLQLKVLPASAVAAAALVAVAAQFEIYDGLLYKVAKKKGNPLLIRLAVPAAFRMRVMKEYHGTPLAGHFGVKRTYDTMYERFFWPNMLEDIRRFVLACPSCSRRKDQHGHGRGHLQPVVTSRPMQLLEMDAVGPLPVTAAGNKYLIVFCDHFTKWVEAFPVKRVDGQTAARCFMAIESRFGPVENLMSDQGKAFDNALLKRVAAMSGVEKVRTTPYHPQGNGLVERFNQTLELMMSLFVNVRHADWDEFVDLCLWAYRSSPHAATGKTPFEMMLGRIPTLHGDLAFPVFKSGEPSESYPERLRETLRLVHSLAEDHALIYRDKMRTYLARHEAHKDFKVGEKVWVFRMRKHPGRFPKFESPWIGPYEVLERKSDALYKVRLVGAAASAQPQFENACNLKRFWEPAKAFGEPPLVSGSREGEGNVVKDVPRLPNAADSLMPISSASIASVDLPSLVSSGSAHTHDGPCA
jgi:transposase InsO family protein